MKSTALIVLLCVAMVVVIIGSAYAVFEAQKEKREVLEKLNQERSNFLSRISYDIRTPMNAIIGTAALGMEEVNDPEKMKECLNKINSSSQFLLGLLNDLVDVSRIENGKFRLHKRSYSFSAFMDGLQTMIEPLCTQKDIIFDYPREDININMQVDPMRFNQLFFNLLTNAVKFTPEGGRVSFRLCNYATHNNIFSADYIVKDTGIGMSREFQQILFEPFTQETSARTERRNGVGLGLAISRNIVDLMGGTISITSELGKGTEVKIHLDIETASIQPEKTVKTLKDSETNRILSGKRVLLVEDHPLNVEITRKLLEKKKMLVESAENGQLAVEAFERNPEYYFDAILMDIRMPVMNGLVATRTIRHVKHPDAQIIPIIAMTANISEEDIESCRNAGMNAHIGKPVEPQKLYQVLSDYLSDVI